MYRVSYSLTNCTEIYKTVLSITYHGSSHHGSVVMNPISIPEDTSSIPGLAQWVKDCHELWYRSQIRLRIQITVAVA